MALRTSRALTKLFKIRIVDDAIYLRIWRSPRASCIFVTVLALVSPLQIVVRCILRRIDQR